jgi:HPt (histidine-containing phosphotransfer) domain-containing protein
MDGLEASAKILELNTGSPVVAMTANIMSNDMKLYMKSGMNDCLGKPFTSQELWRCLLKYLKPQSWQPLSGHNQAQDDVKLRYKRANNFVKSSQDKCKDIKEAIDAGDIKLAHRLAHTLRGNAGQLGKFRLQEAAADVEHHLRNGENLVSPKQIAVLETELRTAIAQLEIELETTFASHYETLQPEVEFKPLNLQSTLELIQKLEPMLEAGNPLCLKLISDLHLVPESCDPLSLRYKLVQEMTNLDFDLALATLAELKKRCAL